jgi:hypothetical protein
MYCLNCHRADVYGKGAAAAPAYTSMSRWNHADDVARVGVYTGAGMPLNNTTVSCLHCHGARKTDDYANPTATNLGHVGAIHGTSMGIPSGSAGTAIAGKRFLNGASWYGHSTGASANCITITNTDVYSACNKHTGAGASAAGDENYTY